MKRIVLLMLVMVTSACFGMLKTIADTMELITANPRYNLKSEFRMLIPMLTEEDAKTACNLLDVHESLLKPWEKQLVFFKWCIFTFSGPDYEINKTRARVTSYQLFLNGTLVTRSEGRQLLYERLDGLLQDSQAMIEPTFREQILSLLSIFNNVEELGAVRLSKKIPESMANPVAFSLAQSVQQLARFIQSLLIEYLQSRLTNWGMDKNIIIERIQQNKVTLFSEVKRENGVDLPRLPLDGLGETCFQLLKGMTREELLLLHWYTNRMGLTTPQRIVLIIRQALQMPKKREREALGNVNDLAYQLAVAVQTVGIAPHTISFKILKSALGGLDQLLDQLPYERKNSINAVICKVSELQGKTVSEGEPSSSEKSKKKQKAHSSESETFIQSEEIFNRILTAGNVEDYKRELGLCSELAATNPSLSQELLLLAFKKRFENAAHILSLREGLASLNLQLQHTPLKDELEKKHALEILVADLKKRIDEELKRSIYKEQS